MPQPPSAASVRSTHVRVAYVGSPAILATIAVASATKLLWPALFRAPGGVSTCTGSSPLGQPIDTGSVGAKTFTVTATVLSGNTTPAAQASLLPT